MANLTRTRKRFVVAASVLAAITLLAIAYLLFPVGASNTELAADLLQANKEVAMKENQAQPLRGLPEKLVKTNEDIVKFYRERLPAEPSDISDKLGKLAAANGVALSDVKYENFDTDIPQLRQVVVEAQLSGEYSKLARFINTVERDKTFLIVDGITLDDQKGGAVRLQLRFETYLRPAFVELASTEKPREIKLPSSTKKPDNKKAQTPAAAKAKK